MLGGGGFASSLLREGVVPWSLLRGGRFAWSRLGVGETCRSWWLLGGRSHGVCLEEGNVAWSVLGESSFV